MGKNTWSKSRLVIDIRYISPVLVLTLKKAVRTCDAYCFYGRGTRTAMQAKPALHKFDLTKSKIWSLTYLSGSRPVPDTKKQHTSAMYTVFLAGVQGLEPWALGFGDQCSTN